MGVWTFAIRNPTSDLYFLAACCRPRSFLVRDFFVRNWISSYNKSGIRKMSIIPWWFILIVILTLLGLVLYRPKH
jgi:hypothetical protein